MGATTQPGQRAALLAHIIECHTARDGRGSWRRSWAFPQLSLWHLRRHARRGNPNHFHQAPGEMNLGSGSRPAGWRTGADAHPTIPSSLNPSQTNQTNQTRSTPS